MIFLQGSYKSQFWIWLFAWQTTSHGFYLSTPMPIFKYLPTVCSLALLIKSDLGNTFQNSPFCMFFKFCQISRKYKPIYCLKVKFNQICIFYLFFSSCLCTCLNGYFLGKWILTSAVNLYFLKGEEVMFHVTYSGFYSLGSFSWSQALRK